MAARHARAERRVSPHVRAIVSALAVIGALLSSAGPTASKAAPLPVHLVWLRVDPLQPRTLFLEGVFGTCSASFGGLLACPPWLMRSTDGGAHWRDVSAAVEGVVYGGLTVILHAATVAADSRHVYLERETGDGNAHSGEALMWSNDGGLSWGAATSHDRNWQGPGNYFHCASPPAGYHGGFVSFVISPVSVARVYAMFGFPGGCGLVRSSDNGKTFFAGTDPVQLAHDPSHFADFGTVVADATRLNTVYFNVTYYL